MLFKDRVRIALRNIAAGDKMSRKIVYGMTFLFMILSCSVVLINSYVDYMNDYNQEHMEDCYYYSEFQRDEVTGTWIKEMLNHCQEEKEQYHAKTVSLFCTLQLKEGEEELFAKNVKVNLGNEEYLIENYFVYKRKAYQNIYGETSPIEIALYKDESAMFVGKEAVQGATDYLIGRYPSNPGEVMLDTYILNILGVMDVTESILGKTFSLCSFDEQGEEVVVEEYILTGILNEEVLAERESMTTSDYHFEHIYLNPREDDLEQFEIARGSIRYYFGDYREYVENYNNTEALLGGDIRGIYSPDSKELRLTQNGIKFCFVYLIMHNIGKILLVVASAIAMISTLSIFYIFQFYRNRNQEYLSMLLSIGMKKKDRRWIYFMEISSMMVIATLIGSYLSTIILILFNSVIEQVINFSIVFDLKSVLLSLIFSWMYFGLILLYIMRKE